MIILTFYINALTRISTLLSISMKLTTGEIKKALPKLYEQESLGFDAIAYIKFFTPDPNWSWYVTEFDGKDLFLRLCVVLKKKWDIFCCQN